MASNAFSVTISAVDKASAQLDAINKRMAAMNAPAERFTKSLAKFDEVSGINRLAEGMGSLGNNALGAFRAVERLAGPMGAITSAASVGGLVALVGNYAALGNTLRNTAGVLNMPTDQLSRMQNAFRLSGATAEDATQAVRGMSATLYDAYYKKDDAARARLKAQGVDWQDAKGNIADTGHALEQLSEHLETYADNRTKVSGMASVGVGEGAFPALAQGVAAYRKALEDSDRTGANWTRKMAENAATVKKDWNRLALDLEGIGLKIADDWSGVVDRILQASSRLIEDHPDAVKHAAEVGGVGAAVGGPLVGPRVARSLLRKLRGAPAAGEGEAGAGAGAEAGAGAGAAGAEAGAAAGAEAGAGAAAGGFGVGGLLRFGGPIGAFIASFWPKTIDPNNTEAAILKENRAAEAVLGPYSQGGTTSNLLGKLANSQLGKLLARGEAGKADYNAVNRGAAGNYAAGMENLVNMTVEQVQAAQKAHKFNAAGRYQIIGPTLDAAVKELGLTGKEKFDRATQDRIFEQYLVGSKRSEIADYVTGKSTDLHAALSAMAKEWASVADPDTGLSHYGGVGHNKASISVAEATQALNAARAGITGGGNGQVVVDVRLSGAPPGTTVTATASGVARASPPRVETAMAHAA